MSEHILQDMRQAQGLEADDSSMDTYLLELSPSEQFELYCQWNGLINWSEKLSSVVLELFKEK